MAVQGSATLFLWLTLGILCAKTYLSCANLQFRGDRHVHRFDWREKKYLPAEEHVENEQYISEESESLHRARRDSTDEKCKKQEQDFLKRLTNGDKIHSRFTFVNDSNHGLALTWAGEGDSGSLIIVTTEEVDNLFHTLVKKSVVYRTTDNGMTFENITSKVENAYIKKSNGLQRNPHDSDMIYLIAHPVHGKHKIYTTSNKGDSFTAIDVPFQLSGSLHFHPEKQFKTYILALAESMDKELYMSVDNGLQWTKILEGVHDFSWGSDASEAKDSDYEHKTVYALKISGDPLWNLFEGLKKYSLVKTTKAGSKSSDGKSDWKELFPKAVSFGVEDKFLFSSIVGESDKQRIMQVSTDGGKSWDETILPTIVKDQFYSMLDSSEGLVFMHVDNPGDTGFGTLYTSAGKGIIFTESLEKHLYPNYGEQTDFYKVESMRGVYIASQMSDDESIHSRISYDRGGEWIPLPRPTGAPCKDESKGCTLQLHNSYSLSRGIKAVEPLSSPGAVGLILAHGHVADSLQTTKPDVFITTDGGYSWRKTLDGPHHYQIADSGGLLLAVPINDDRTAKTLKFSLDEGNCWHSYNFTDEELIFTGILTEPGSKSMNIGLWGFGGKDRIWRVYTIDFNDLIINKCEVKDYETFTPHSKLRSHESANVQGCLLGMKETFLKLKPDSWCKNGYEFQGTKSKEKCPCTREDYECDFGYYRPDGSDSCIEQKEFSKKKLKICERGHVEQFVNEGFRKIPGDKCTGGNVHLEGKLIDLEKTCKEGSKEILIGQIKLEYVPSEPSAGLSPSSSKRRSLIIGAVAIVLVGLVCVMSLYFLCRYYALRRHQVTYRYSLLNQSEEQDFDSELENALTSQKTLYHDSEDEDLERAPSNTPNGRAMSNIPNGRPKVQSYHDDSDVDMLE